jgi:hypothetical protein
MGARGPKPGFKAAKAKQAQQAAELAAQQAQQAAAPPPQFVCDPEQARALSAAHRENPEKLGGEALKQLAHRLGIARSEADRMDDAKLRQQLRIRAYHYAEAEA